MANYPKQGSIIWVDLSPTQGSEQLGRRPVLVLSKDHFNKHGLCIIVPITSKIKGYPFEINLSSTLTTSGALLVSHIRSIDWRQLNAQHIEFIDDSTFEKVLRYLLAHVELPV